MEISSRSLKALLGKRSKSINKSRPVGLGRGYEKSLQYALSCGIKAEVVYDVGAGTGTPWLYEAFPGARHVLLEPLPAHVDVLKRTYTSQNFEIYQIGVGAEPGLATLHVPATPGSRSTWSSLYRPTRAFASFTEARGVAFAVEDIDVEIAPLNDFVRGGANVIKIDTEGSELDILKSGERVLESCELLILELSVFPRFEGEGRLGDIVCFLHQRGFELFDIPLIFYPIPDRDPTLIDAFFVPSRRGRAGKWIT